MLPHAEARPPHHRHALAGAQDRRPPLPTRQGRPPLAGHGHANLAQRGADGVIEYCEANGIGVIPWFPLGSGTLSRQGGPLDTVAHQIGATVSQVNLAWLLRRSPVMLPIPGTSSVAHLEENCAAVGVALSEEQYDTLVEARKPLRRWALAG